jgi:hypothetical protein
MSSNHDTRARSRSPERGYARAMIARFAAGSSRRCLAGSFAALLLSVAPTARANDGGADAADAAPVDAAAETSGTCVATADCAVGSICQSGTCVPSGVSSCSSDRAQSIAADSSRHSCSPYLCDVATGVCGSICATNADCATNYSCDTTNGQCVSTAYPPASSSKGCSAAAGTSEAASAVACVFGAAVLFSIARRRRRLSA